MPVVHPCDMPKRRSYYVYYYYVETRDEIFHQIVSSGTETLDDSSIIPLAIAVTMAWRKALLENLQRYTATAQKYHK